MALTPKGIVMPQVPCEGDLDLKIGVIGSDEIHDLSRQDFYHEIQEDRVRGWFQTAADYEDNPDDFYNAWWYLNHHPAFYAFAYGPGSHRAMSLDERCHERHLLSEDGINRCVRIDVHKVNATTRSTEDEPQTDTEVWIELGHSPWPLTPDKHNPEEVPYHDYMLDCGGDTTEAAIIKAARNVWEVYGNDRRICDAPYDKRNYAAVLTEEDQGFATEDAIHLRYGTQDA